MDLSNLNKNRKKRKTEIDTFVYVKVPPQAKDLEEATLGAIMIKEGAIDVVAEWLIPEAFYVDAHKRIYNAALLLLKNSQPIDIYTICEQLRSTEELEQVGGTYYVTQLTNHVVNDSHLETHAKHVLAKYLKRELIRLGGEMINDSYEDTTDVFDLLEGADRGLLQISNYIHTKQYERADAIIVRRIKEIQRIRLSPESLSGVTSGYVDIDKLTHGWQNTDLIIIAARPSVGKTAFALNLARNAVLALKPVPTAFFSLEMSSGQLMDRLFSAEAEIPLDKIQRGRMEDEDMKELFAKAVRSLANAPLFIDDSPNLNLYELRAKCRRLKRKEDVGLIIVDYLQLMSSVEKSTKNREQVISEITRGLKILAKELKVPIIALSQLSRAVESRGEKVPQLSDLRESGAIEQDADVVMFLYRPDYYAIARDEKGESNPGETHVKFAKHRNGKLDTVKLMAKLWCQKFFPYQEQKIDFSKRKKKEPGEPELSGPPDPDGNLPF